MHSVPFHVCANFIWPLFIIEYLDSFQCFHITNSLRNILLHKALCTCPIICCGWITKSGFMRWKDRVWLQINYTSTEKKKIEYAHSDGYCQVAPQKGANLNSPQNPMGAPMNLDSCAFHCFYYSKHALKTMYLFEHN